MTVAELIAYLQTQDQDAKVILSKDGEGNNFSPLSEGAEGTYVASTPWHGEFYSSEDAEDLGIEGTPSLCLWPDN